MSDEYGLGRNPTPFDARDWKPETLKAMVKLGVVHPVKWSAPIYLHQGQTPHCVGFSGATFMSAAGSQVGSTTEGITNELGHELYYECKVEDGEAQEENGSNLRSLAKVLKRRGVIDAYSITADFDSILEWVSSYGVVILGLPWYEGMFTKDAQGVIHPTGRLRGGHAICDYAVAQSLDNGLHNTWGVSWGSCWIANEDLQRLLQEGGDALLTVRKGPPLELPWELESLVDSNLLVVSEDDRESILAAYFRGAFKGYPDGTLRPRELVTEHQVRTVLHNLGLKAPAEAGGEYTRNPTRRWVHEKFPQLTFAEERWEEKMTRYQLLILVGRYLRGV